MMFEGGRMHLLEDSHDVQIREAGKGESHQSTNENYKERKVVAFGKPKRTVYAAPESNKKAPETALRIVPWVIGVIVWHPGGMKVLTEACSQE
jgi:hypothetical protein